MRQMLAFAFVAVIIAAVMPQSASAMCQYTLCDSYGIYFPDSNHVIAHSYTSDYTGYWWVAVDGTLTGPNGPVQNASSYWQWGEAWADYDWVPDRVGIYTVDARHYLSDAPYYWYYMDGTTTYDISATIPLPTGEETEGVVQYSDGVLLGGVFTLRLTPYSSWWAGNTIYEDLGAFTDTCNAAAGGNGPLAGNPAPAPPFSPDYTGRYQDTLAVASEWVQFYISNYSRYGECSWYGSQTMHYESWPGQLGTIYAINAMEIYVNGSGYAAGRGNTYQYFLVQ